MSRRGLKHITPIIIFDFMMVSRRFLVMSRNKKKKIRIFSLDFRDVLLNIFFIFAIILLYTIFLFTIIIAVISRMSWNDRYKFIISNYIG